jgi:hypothetical protein
MTVILHPLFSPDLAPYVFFSLSKNSALTTWHPLSAKVGTSFANKRRPLGRYSSLADYKPRSLFVYPKTQLSTQERFGDIIMIKKYCRLFLQSFIQRTSTDASNSSGIAGLAVLGPRRSWLLWRKPHGIAARCSKLYRKEFSLEIFWLPLTWIWGHVVA